MCCKARHTELRQNQTQETGGVIEHAATDPGLRVDPGKVQAILEIPQPTDVLGVQRILLGMSQYLAKFLPHLSDITKPLRELTHQEVEFEVQTATGKGPKQTTRGHHEHTCAEVL